MPGFPTRLRFPPSSVTDDLGKWLYEVWAVINGMPRLSWFSGTSPNLSNLTGFPGDIGINVASGSTTTRAWILGGNPASGLTTKGWVTLMIGPA